MDLHSVKKIFLIWILQSKSKISLQATIILHKGNNIEFYFFIGYFCAWLLNNPKTMKLTDNIKMLREEKGFLQKQVAAEIGLKPAHYNKIEKGIVEPSVDILDKLARLYGMTIDQVVHSEKNIPEEVNIEDKSLMEQVKLIQQLDEKDRSTVFNIIDTMLTKRKFMEFFQKNVAAL